MWKYETLTRSAVMCKFLTILMSQSWRLWTGLEYLWRNSPDNEKISSTCKWQICTSMFSWTSIQRRIQGLVKTFNNDGWSPTSCDIWLILLTWLKKINRESIKETFSLGDRLKGENKNNKKPTSCSSWNLLRLKTFKEDPSKANEDYHRKTRSEKVGGST